jgi:Flp pilus assembly protein TadG
MEKKSLRRIASWGVTATRSARAMLRDRRGVAAVEFALVAPLLLALFFLTLEFSQAIDADKKVGRMASMAADLITQQNGSTNQADVDAILEIGEAILQPYNRSAPTLTATAIRISNDATPIATVAWSRELSGDVSSAGPAPGLPVTTVPTNLMIKGSFLIRVQAHLDYKPILTWTAQQKASIGLAATFSSLSMNETYYLRPRMSPAITCSDCNP